MATALSHPSGDEHRPMRDRPDASARYSRALVRHRRAVDGQTRRTGAPGGYFFFFSVPPYGRSLAAKLFISAGF